MKSPRPHIQCVECSHSSEKLASLLDFQGPIIRDAGNGIGEIVILIL